MRIKIVVHEERRTLEEGSYLVDLMGEIAKKEKGAYAFNLTGDACWDLCMYPTTKDIYMVPQYFSEDFQPMMLSLEGVDYDEYMKLWTSDYGKRFFVHDIHTEKILYDLIDSLGLADSKEESEETQTVLQIELLKQLEENSEGGMFYLNVPYREEGKSSIKLTMYTLR